MSSVTLERAIIPVGIIHSASNTYVFESMIGFEKVFLRDLVFTPEDQATE